MCVIKRYPRELKRMIINKFMYQLHAYKVKLWGGYEKTFEGNGSFCGIAIIYFAHTLLHMLVGLTPHEILSVSKPV